VGDGVVRLGEVDVDGERGVVLAGVVVEAVDDGL